jgi:hypothetical protein
MGGNSARFGSLTPLAEWLLLKPRTRVLPALAAATFRIGLIMERGLMRQRISPGPDYTGPRRWDGR